MALRCRGLAITRQHAGFCCDENLLTTGKHGEALTELRKALQLQGDLHEARYWLGVAHVRLNDRTAAFEEYKKLQEGDKAWAEKLFKEIYG